MGVAAFIGVIFLLTLQPVVLLICLGLSLLGLTVIADSLPREVIFMEDRLLVPSRNPFRPRRRLEYPYTHVDLIALVARPPRLVFQLGPPPKRRLIAIKIATGQVVEFRDRILAAALPVRVNVDPRISAVSGSPV